MSPLSTAEAKRFYDRFGAKQDKQVSYEAPALELLVSHAELDTARAVFEFGCGTGRFAEELLARHLPPAATYLGVDLSDTMVALASQRLRGHRGRARVAVATGEPTLSLPSRSVDRFLSTYVLDLLTPADIRDVLTEAHRVLEPGGLLCLAGITSGRTALSRVVMALWRSVYSIRPSLVGGCRPIELTEYVRDPPWVIRHHGAVVTRGIASEVLIARASDAAG